MSISGRSVIKICLLLSLVSFLQACQMETAQVPLAETLRHQNNLITRRPRGFRTEPNATGFDFFEVQQQRNPMNLSLSLLPPSTTPPHIPRAWFRVFGLRYRITEENSGLGGTMYNFETIQKNDRCWVVLKSTQQSENGTPSFLVAWAFLQKNHDCSATRFRCSG